MESKYARMVTRVTRMARQDLHLTSAPLPAPPPICCRYELSRQSEVLECAPVILREAPQAQPTLPWEVLTFQELSFQLYVDTLQLPALWAWQRDRNASPLPPGWAWMVEEGSTALHACTSLQLTTAALQQG